MNYDQAMDLQDDEGLSSWRSIGAVAAAWASRIEAERHEAAYEAEPDFAPVAWAAE